jgi:peptide/nickel transport system substrate-binding protein
VTVTFSKPYPDWRSLFSFLMPAHVARQVGFDTGFRDPVADLVSGGPYLVSQLQQGYSLELVRNTRYWEPPANLASITYYFTATTAEVVDALSAGELDVAVLPAQVASFQELQEIGGVSVHAVASSAYEDLDFNESRAPFKSAALREAIMLAVDRSTMASTVLGAYGLATGPMENRAFLRGELDYVDDGPAYDQPQPTTSLQVFTSSGYAQSGGVLKAPGGLPVAISLAASPDDPVAQQLAQEIISSCAAIGIKVSLVDEGPGGALPARWEMAVEVRQVPLSPSRLSGRYATRGVSNVDGYSSTTMDTLLAQIPKAPVAELPALYDQVDAEAWRDFVDLPLVQVPTVVVLSPKLLNVQPLGPYVGNIAWDEQDWGFQAP